MTHYIRWVLRTHDIGPGALTGSARRAIWRRIIIAPEYRPLAEACRSPGARKEPSAVSDQPSAKKKGTAEAYPELVEGAQR